MITLAIKLHLVNMADIRQERSNQAGTIHV